MRTALGMFLAASLLLGCQRQELAADATAVARLAGKPDLSRQQAVELTVPERVAERLDRGLNEDDVVELALNSNREIQASLAEVGIARGQLRQARRLPNPSAEIGIPAEREAQLELGLEFDLTAAILTPVRARSVAPSLQAARFRAARVIVEKGTQARIDYARLAIAERELELAVLLREVYAAELDAVAAAHEAGNVPDLALAERQLNYEQARFAVQQLEAEVASARGRLAQTVGWAASDGDFRIARLPDVIPAAPVTPSDLEARALRSSLDLRASSSELDSLGKQTGYVRALGNTPDVSLRTEAQLLRSEDQLGGSDWAAGGSITTTLPIFDRQDGNLLSKEAEFDAKLRRHLALVAAVRTESRVLAERLARNHEVASMLSGGVVPAAEERVKQLLLQYNSMQVDVLALLGGLRSKLMAQSEAVRAHGEFLVTRAQYMALLSGCLMNDPSRTGAAQLPPAGQEAH